MIGFVFITAVPITELFAWGGGTLEAPSTSTQGAPVSPGSSYLGMRVLVFGTVAQHCSNQTRIL
jgi:hypothetical protein